MPKYRKLPNTCMLFRRDCFLQDGPRKRSLPFVAPWGQPAGIANLGAGLSKLAVYYLRSFALILSGSFVCETKNKESIKTQTLFSCFVDGKGKKIILLAVRVAGAARTHTLKSVRCSQHEISIFRRLQRAALPNPPATNEAHTGPKRPCMIYFRCYRYSTIFSNGSNGTQQRQAEPPSTP